MWRIIFLLAVTYQHALSFPQFVSLKDGKIGVNFGGYHAEAGLGGLLTGNAGHGGLSASAGTPFGQEAAAGLGGLLNGRASGGGYATASAGGNVGASAGLGGIAGEKIFDSGLGAEAHVGETSHSVVSSPGGGLQITKQIGEYAPPSANVNVDDESSVIQKIKPPKKYAVEALPSNVVPVVEKRKQIQVQAAPASVPVPGAFPALRADYAGSVQGGVGGGSFFDSIFNIPIATLKAVNGLLNTKVQGEGGLAVQKSASLNFG